MPILNTIKNKIVSIPIVGLLIKKSKTVSLPGFRGLPIFDVAKFFVLQVRTVGMTERASSIAFNFVMAIPPAIIFLFTMIPFFPVSREFEEGLYSLIRDVVPGEKENSVLIKFLEDFINKPRNGLLSLGFILSIFFSSNAIMGIMRSFDKNYIGFRKRTGLQSRGVALKLTFILFIIIITGTLLMVMQGAVLKELGVESYLLRVIIRDARWAIIVLLFFFSIGLIYRHAPAVQKKWRLLNPGSIVAAFLMILFTVGFSFWVAHFGNYNKLYGSIGTVLIMMLLIYFNSLVLLIGFELNVSISSLKKLADERKNKPIDGIENPV
jgi:membrane protein